MSRRWQGDPTPEVRGGSAVALPVVPADIPERLKTPERGPGGDVWVPQPGGPYDVPEGQYHADRTALSSSGARTLVKHCPARFKWERDNGRPDTPDLEFGRAWHSVLLGGPTVVKIDAKTLRGDAAKRRADEARQAGQIPLCADDFGRVHRMIVALWEHPIAGPLFNRPGRTEQTFVAPDPDTGVLCRTRVDFMPDVADDARVILVDGKTTRSAHPVAFAKSMADYGYHQQGPFYCDVLSWLGLDHALPPRFVLVAQEKEPPHLVTIAEPDEQAMWWGRELNRQALDLYRRCTESGVWPGYEADLPADHGGIARLSLPGWQVAAYEAAYDRRRELIGAPA